MVVDDACRSRAFTRRLLVVRFLPGQGVLQGDGPPFCQCGLLRIANQQLERGSELLALSEQLSVCPYASVNAAIADGQYAGLVAVRVPPAPHLRNELGDVLVSLSALVICQLRNVEVCWNIFRVTRGARDDARSGDANDAAVKILEALASEKVLEVVRGGLEGNAGVGSLHAHLQAPHSAAASAAHVCEIKVDRADLEIATWTEDTLAL